MGGGMSGGGGGGAEKEANVDVDRMVNLAKSGITRNQLKAAKALTDICKSGELSKRWFSEGLIAGLIVMGESKNGPVQIAAGECLIHLSKHPDHHVPIVTEGALPQIMALLKSGKVYQSRVGMQILLNLSAHDENRMQLCNEVTLKTIVKYCKHDQLEMELLALNLLERLCKHPRNHSKIAQVAVLEPVFYPCFSPMKSIPHKTAALACIYELSLTPSAIAKFQDVVIVESSGFSILITLISHYSNDVSTLAVSSLARIANVEKQAIELMSSGILFAVIETVKSKYLKLQLASVTCLRNLSAHTDNQQKICQAGCLSSLIKLARCGNVPLETASAMTIVHLASNPVNRPRIMHSAAFAPLFYHIANSKDEKLKREAKLCVANLFDAGSGKRDAAVKRAVEKFKALREKRNLLASLQIDEVSSSDEDSDDAESD